MENKRKMSGLTRRKKLLIFSFLSLSIIVGLILIGNIYYPSIYGSIYPKTKINVKSDAEMIAFFHAHKEVFSQVTQQVKEMRRLELEKEKEDSAVRGERGKNDKINKNNPELMKQEDLRLIYELDKISSFLSSAKEKHRLMINQELKKLGAGHLNYRYESYFYDGYDRTNGRIDDQMFTYVEKHFLVNRLTEYSIIKGFKVFSEDNQPDKKYVVDNLDNFHSSNNIILTARKREGSTYVHIEGNWYLYLEVRVEPNYDPDYELRAP